ncbi:MAG TPA: hypothetical protein VJZ32_11005 [Candidatus Bathyarchaeia archaeon]|nr:hypothetical protein [Candidatus Bathyarchaeia archaeon]
MKPTNFPLLAMVGLGLLIAVVLNFLPSLPLLQDRLTVGLILAEIVGFGGLISVEVFSFL